MAIRRPHCDSAEIFALEIAHHADVFRLASGEIARLQCVVAGLEILLADGGVACVPVSADVDAHNNRRRDAVILLNQGRAVGLGLEVSVAEGAERRQLGAVIRLALGLADRGRDEAEAEELFLAEAADQRLVIADVERRLWIPLDPKGWYNNLSTSAMVQPSV